ncbi:hypothetical protein GW17_00026112 [Ensete ventricosum]|nr:hypothetical protein GW17_00026112 [Ensete ventricosum]RZS28244.1 hypothetical protein BHM03_00061811 [Ensete ventricosum]
MKLRHRVKFGQCGGISSEGLLGDSSKGSGSSLGTQREIVEKKIGGLAARMSDAAGLCWKSGRWPAAFDG